MKLLLAALDCIITILANLLKRRIMNLLLAATSMNNDYAFLYEDGLSYSILIYGNIHSI